MLKIELEAIAKSCRSGYFDADASTAFVSRFCGGRNAKGLQPNNICDAIAKIINRSSSALLIVESTEAMDAVSLAYSLKPEVKYKVINTEDDLSSYLNRFDNIFLLKPTFDLEQKLISNPQVDGIQVYKSHVFSEDEFPLNLWRIR